MAVEIISEIENRLIEIIQSEEQIGNKIEKKEILRKMQDTIKYGNIHVMGVPEGEERERRAEKYARNNDLNFSYLMKILIYTSRRSSELKVG